MPVRNRAIERFLAAATVVVLLDLSTKHWATALPATGVHVSGPLDLALTYNTGSAFGTSFSAYPWQLSALATLIALALAGAAVRALSEIDHRAPIALGLIAGAALGNLASMLVPPAGVADFIAVQVSAGSRIVMNLADVAAYAGVAMVLRSVLLLGKAIGAQRTVRPAVGREIEIGIPVFVEGNMEIPGSRPSRERDRPALSSDVAVADRLDHSR